MNVWQLRACLEDLPAQYDEKEVLIRLNFSDEVVEDPDTDIHEIDGSYAQILDSRSVYPEGDKAIIIADYVDPYIDERTPPEPEKE